MTDEEHEVMKAAVSMTAEDEEKEIIKVWKDFYGEDSKRILATYKNQPRACDPWHEVDDILLRDEQARVKRKLKLAREKWESAETFLEVCRHALIVIPVLAVGIPLFLAASFAFGMTLMWSVTWMIKPVVWLFEVLPSP